MSIAIVQINNLNKTFPGVHALKNAHFELFPGEVHALVGENGAGKSTLMKILAGVYQMDSGEILFEGKLVNIQNPKQAQGLGISIIHQELNLMNHLTAAQNIYIGREPHWPLGILNEKKINNQAQAVFKKLHLKLDPRSKVGDMTVAAQQMVEIAKAISWDVKVLIMDEPTAALNESEIEDLFEIIRSLKEQGVGIVYISHRMDELARISDRVTVMRDGAHIATTKTADTNTDAIIRLMVGRELFETAHIARKSGEQPVVFEARNLNRGKVLKDISFKVRAGEILGFAGLMGAGRTEVARAIFGADPIDSGALFIDGKKVHVSSPADAVKCGIGYLSEDRKRFGLALTLDVSTNTALASMRNFVSRLGVVKDKSIRQAASEQVQKLEIKTPSLAQQVKFLSGGNQQKIVIAKWLLGNCKILFFDEPTRGIDVGAKHEVYKLLNELAAEGKAIVMISSELPEVLRMSHRILVMCEGKITGELDAADASQEKIMQYATERESVAEIKPAAH